MVVVQISFGSRAAEQVTATPLGQHFLTLSSKGLSKALKCARLSRLSFTLKKTSTSTTATPSFAKSMPISFNPPSSSMVPPTPPLTFSSDPVNSFSNSSNVLNHCSVRSEVLPISESPDVPEAEANDRVQGTTDPSHNPEVSSSPRKITPILGLIKNFFFYKAKVCS